MFVKQIVIKEGGEVRYVNAVEDGEYAWYFISLFPERYNDYKKCLKKRVGALKEFGTILASGWGKHAPDDVMQFMQERYNVIISKKPAG